MNWIELTATVFGAASVWLTIRRNIWCWPVGLVQIGLYIFIFLDAKLYADMVLHIIYVFLQVYGWYYWVNGTQDHQGLRVTTLPLWVSLAFAGLGVVLTGIWGYALTRYTDADYPYPDSFIAAMSLVAQWLLAKKKLETWYFWLLVDIVAIWLYGQKALYLTAGLYGIFFILASRGLYEWSRARKQPSIISAECKPPA